MPITPSRWLFASATANTVSGPIPAAIPTDSSVTVDAGADTTDTNDGDRHGTPSNTDGGASE